MHWLIDWRSRYGYYDNLLFRSHWVTGTLGEGKTTVTTRTRNTGLTRLHVFLMVSVGGCLWVAEKPFALPNKEMGYLWDRGNNQPFSYFSIMATISGNPNIVSGSNLISNDAKSELKLVPSGVTSLTTESLGAIPLGTLYSLKKSWADQVEDFSSNLQSKNLFTR